MNSIVGIVIFFVSALALVSSKQPQCSIELPSSTARTQSGGTRTAGTQSGGTVIKPDWANMEDECLKGVKLQVKKEFDASYAYLSMAAYFSRDKVNRPGFAELYFNAAKEEREHGIKLIEYLLMRGELTQEIGNLYTVSQFEKAKEVTSGKTSLKKALELETDVTNAIIKLIKTCEGITQLAEGNNPSSGGNNPTSEAKPTTNDYHLVDYLSGVYLEEQYKGQRELAGKLATLTKMELGHGDKLAEFLFDKQL